MGRLSGWFRDQRSGGKENLDEETMYGDAGRDYYPPPISPERERGRQRWSTQSKDPHPGDRVYFPDPNERIREEDSHVRGGERSGGFDEGNKEDGDWRGRGENGGDARREESVEGEGGNGGALRKEKMGLRRLLVGR